jgi:hypothetical protein
MKKLLFLACASAVVAFSACSKSDSSATAGGNSSMSVYLVDGPANYEKIYLDIQSVQVKAGADDTESGWQTVPVRRTGIYDLLNFKNGLDTLLGTVVLPAGKISQLRLVLGPNNSIVSNGVTYPLSTPSAQQSGLKLAINANLVAGVDYKLWIDFDAARSVVQTGNNSYILKPVIRTFTQATSGGVKGIVLPVAAKGWVFAIANVADTIASTPADATSGAFMLRGLPAATYRLGFHATAGTYRDTTYTGVNVVTGAVTDAGTVTLR